MIPVEEIDLEVEDNNPVFDKGIDEEEQLITTDQYVMHMESALEIVAFTDVSSFTRPLSIRSWNKRVKHNVSRYGKYYASWYVLITAAIVFADPFKLVVWLILLGVCSITIHTHYNPIDIKLNRIVVDSRLQKLLLIPICTSVVVFGGVLNTVLWVLMVGSLTNGIHASLRSLNVQEAHITNAP